MFNKIPYNIQALDSNVCYQVVYEFVSSSSRLLPFDEQVERIALWDMALKECALHYTFRSISMYPY